MQHVIRPAVRDSMDSIEESRSPYALALMFAPSTPL
jgi:hypothetical protein